MLKIFSIECCNNIVVILVDDKCIIPVGEPDGRTILTHGPGGHVPGGGPTSIGAPIPHVNPCPIDGAQPPLS